MSPFAHAMREHISGDCSSDFAIAGSFPFGSVPSRHFDDHEEVLRLLRAHETQVNDFTRHFLETYHPLLPVLDPGKFRSQIDTFQSRLRECSPSWLAQYLVVLGLGAYASTRDHKLAARFYYASEACLAQSAYLFRPCITDISTLCLMVLAKSAAQATCWAMDTCWNVMGLIVRLSMMTCLHQEWMPHFDEPAINQERNTRRRLWSVVVFLDLQMSLVVGQQSLLPQDALGPVTTAEHHTPGSREDCWDAVLPRAYPVVWKILARVNARTDPITYDEVMLFDTQLDQHIHPLSSQIPSTHPACLSSTMFLSRAVLVLHRRHALDNEAPSQYPASYRKSLEASLAVSRRHVALCGSSSQLDLIGRPYMLDFFAAAFTACIHLFRRDARGSLLGHGYETPLRETVVHVVESSLRLLARERDTSLCFRTGYTLLHAVYQLALSEC